MTLKETINNLLDTLMHKTKDYEELSKFRSEIKHLKDTFNKAKKKYLKVDNRSNIILYIEKSILGKGNLGLALTRNKIYWRNNILNSGIEIEISTIQYVNLIGDELMIKTSDGDITFPFDDIVLKCFLLKVIYDI